MGRFSILVMFGLIGFLLLGMVPSGQGTHMVNLDQSLRVHEVFSNTTVWDNMDETFNLVNPIIVDGVGNLTVINSHIVIIGPINGIEVQNGASLTIIDSIVEFDGVDHAIFGNTYGQITLHNATLSSVEADASHFEGNYLFVVDHSTFRDSGDDGFHVENNDLPITVTNSLITNNGDDGFDMLNVNSKVTLQSSRLISNKGHAIKFVDSGNLSVIDTFLDGTESTPDDDNRGMDLEDSDFVHVHNVTIVNFPNDGIKARRVPALIENVHIENVGDEGIEFENTNSPFPVNIQSTSIVNAYGGDGIKVELVKGKVVINNTRVISGGDDGIQVTGGLTILEVQNTFVTKSFEDGFELDTSTSTLFENVTSFENNESGIKFKNTGAVIVRNSFVVGNKIWGVDGLNISSISVENTNASYNLQGGVRVISSNHTILNQSVMSRNIATDAASVGVHFEAIPYFQINNSKIDSNSGSGIDLLSSKGTIFKNSISSNKIDGIKVRGTSQFSIENNTITQNSNNGISVSNSSRGTIRYNTFGNNGIYGLFVESGSNQTVDANDNYWGSNVGPIYQAEGQSGRDGIFGNVEIDSVLNQKGESIEFVPPAEINFQQLFYFLLLGLVILTLSGIIGYYILQNRWKQSTNPLALISVSRVGLPIHEYNFKEGLVDPALISGFLSAISSFGAEMFKEEDKRNTKEKQIREIQSRDNVILLYVIERSMLALVVENSNPVVRKLLKGMGEDFKSIAEMNEGETFDQKAELVSTEQFTQLVDQNFKPIL